MEQNVKLLSRGLIYNQDKGSEPTFSRQTRTEEPLMQKRDELLEVFLMTFGVNYSMSTKCLPLAFCIASDPNTPAEILEHLARTDNTRLLEKIAEHPNVKPFLLEILASHTSPDVRAAVSENPNVTEDIVATLCQDDHPDVRFRLAENPNLSLDALNELAEDSNPYVAHRARLTLMKMERPESLLKNIMHLVSARFAAYKAV